MALGNGAMSAINTKSTIRAQFGSQIPQHYLHFTPTGSLASSPLRALGSPAALVRQQAPLKRGVLKCQASAAAAAPLPQDLSSSGLAQLAGGSGRRWEGERVSRPAGWHCPRAAPIVDSPSNYVCRVPHCPSAAPRPAVLHHDVCVCGAAVPGHVGRVPRCPAV
jgi:hypothetical protein